MPISVAERRFFNCRRLLWPTLALLAACAGGPAPRIVEYFEEDTVTAVVRADEPVVFVARRPGVSALGGDLVSVGPLSTILSGEERQFLWLGFWTTVDRFKEQTEPPPPPSAVAFEADDQRIELTAATAFPIAPGKKRPAYPAPSPGVQDVYFPVSTAQLNVLASATRIVLHAAPADAGSRAFVTQDDMGSMLSAFVDYVR